MFEPAFLGVLVWSDEHVQHPHPPRPVLAPETMAPGANAPGSPGRSAWEPSATPGFG